MVPGLMAAAAPHVARAVAKHAFKRGAAYIAGSTALGGVGGYLTGRNQRRKVPTSRSDQRDTGTGSEFTKLNISYGKIPKVTLPKILQSCVQTVTARVTNANQYDNAGSVTVFPGAFILQNYQVGAVGNTYLPILLVDVTSWMNNFAGSAIYANTVYTAQLDTSGNVIWGNSSPWVLERSAAPTTSAATMPNASDLCKSINMKMLFYGATARPTKFAIDLIQIKEDYLHPDSTVTNAGTNGGVNYQVQRSAFWQTLLRPYMYSPLVTGDNNAVKGRMKTLQHTEFLLQEKLTNEPTSFAGHMKQVNYQLNLNRIQRYDWQDQALATQAGLEGTNLVTNIAQPASVVAPRSRLYVMIRGQATFNTATSQDTSKSGSFDLVMKGIHQNIV